MELNYFYLKEGNGKRCFSYEDVKEKLTSPLLDVLSGAKKQELAESDGAFTLAGQEKTITAFLKENTSANNALLSFVNTNNAHHLTYYLAKEAVRRFGCGECRILNIDAHADCADSGKFLSETSAAKMTCGNWGTAFAERGKGKYFVCGAYEAGTEAGTFFQKSAQPYDTQGENLACSRLINAANLDAKEYSAVLMGLLQDGTPLYLSVDMDFCGGADRTDRKINDLAFDGVACLKELVAAVPDRFLIGADITGFPKPAALESGRMQQYLNDIYTVYEGLKAKLRA